MAEVLSNRLLRRPRIGALVVPFVVDEMIEPIDFKMLDPARVRRCAQERLCAVCGRSMAGSRFAFIGPHDGRTCFADPWMHEPCARYTIQHCPFVSGRQGFRDPLAEEHPELTARYENSHALVVARGGGAHLDTLGGWHFEVRPPVYRIEAIR